jgi:hypothetical protein
LWGVTEKDIECWYSPIDKKNLFTGIRLMIPPIPVIVKF